MTDRTSDWTVARLADRLQIEEKLYLYCRGIDRIQGDILASAFHDDAMILKANGTITLAQFIQDVTRRHPLVRHAFHMVANHIIDFVGEDEAFVESWYLGMEQHAVSPDAEERVDRVYRGRYGDKFTRRNGEWRIAERMFVHDHFLNVPVDDRLAANANKEPAAEGNPRDPRPSIGQVGERGANDVLHQKRLSLAGGA